MTDFYPYLIASLPMLHFGIKPPFPFEGLLNFCKDFIPQKHYQLLSNLPRPEEYSAKQGVKQPTICKWIEFDTLLRNELVKLRAARKHIEPSKYLRPDHHSLPLVAHIALAAQRSPSIIEGEKILDEARWKALEELALGHYFDLDFLIVYGLKLLILERWQRIDTADKPRLLEKVLR